MKKSCLISIICALIMGLLCGCNKSNTIKNNNANINVIQSSIIECGNFKDKQKSFDDLQNNADTTVIAKVKSSHSYKFNNIIWTNYVIDVQRQIKNEDSNFPKEIEIRFTGGNIDNESQPFLSYTKPLEKNQTYLLALKKVFPNDPSDNYYAVLGGEYQGIFKIQLDNKNNIIKVDNFNYNNDLEDGLTNNSNIESFMKKK